MNIRLRGLLMLVGGAAVTAVAVKALTSPGGYFPYGYLPLVISIIGLLEVISGVPFSQLSKKWETLPWYSKLPIGVVLGTVLFYVFMGIVMFAFLWGH